MFVIDAFGLRYIETITIFFFHCVFHLPSPEAPENKIALSIILAMDASNRQLVDVAFFCGRDNNEFIAIQKRFANCLNFVKRRDYSTASEKVSNLA